MKTFSLYGTPTGVESVFAVYLAEDPDGQWVRRQEAEEEIERITSIYAKYLDEAYNKLTELTGEESK